MTQSAQPAPAAGPKRLGPRIEKRLDAVYLRFRHRKAFSITDGRAGDLRALRKYKYALLVTFRRSGVAVPTVTWFGVDDDGRLFTHAFANAGKVKRLRNDPRVLVAPSTSRGRPRGPALEGRGRILAPEEWDHAEKTIASNYGLGRWLYLTPSRREPEAGTYLEIVSA